MNTQPGIQTAFPWCEGPVPLQPTQNIPDDFIEYAKAYGEALRDPYDCQKGWDK